MELTKKQMEQLKADPYYHTGMEKTDLSGVKWLLDHPPLNKRKSWSLLKRVE